MSAKIATKNAAKIVPEKLHFRSVLECPAPEWIVSREDGPATVRATRSGGGDILPDFMRGKEFEELDRAVVHPEPGRRSLAGGGGYAEPEAKTLPGDKEPAEDRGLLSDTSLLWMIRRAQDCGLEFYADTVKDIRESALSPSHDSFSAFYKIVDTIGLHPDGGWRSIGTLGAAPHFEPVSTRFKSIHSTVVKRFHTEPKVTPKHWPRTFDSAIMEMKKMIEDAGGTGQT